MIGKWRNVVTGLVLTLGLYAGTAHSATIGLVLLEQIQDINTGIDINLLPEEDAEFERSIALEILAGIENSAGFLNLIARLEEQGHTVFIYGAATDDELGLAHMVENNDLIILSEAPGSGETGNFYRGAEVPFLFTESFILDDMGVVPSDQSSLFDEDINARFLRKVKEHPITADLPDEFAPLAEDTEGSGKPFVGNYTTMGDESFNLFPDNVLLELVDPVFPEPTIASSITTTGELPALMAWDVGELNNNPARVVFLAFGSENATGVGLENSDLFADGSTAGIFMFDVMGELGYQVLDQTVEWLLAEPGTGVNNWNIY